MYQPKGMKEVHRALNGKVGDEPFLVCLCLSGRLLVGLSICLSLGKFISLFVYQSISLSAYQFISLSVYYLCLFV